VKFAKKFQSSGC